MAKTASQLDVEIANGHATHCNTCTRPVGSPFRRYDQGSGHKIVAGCIDAAHDGHLYGNSLAWHMRPESKKLRAEAKKRLRELLKGSR